MGTALATATLILYWQVSSHEFIPYDDYGYVTNNYYLQPGITWENIHWALTTGYVANWHPLTWISHMLDYQLFGLDPAGHHLHNVLLHTLTSVLLFLVFWKMTRELFASFVVACVFAFHPLHVESVAWVSERKDVLSGLFWVLTMAAYVRYAEAPSGRRYLVVLLAFVLGLLSKPMVVTLPFVLLLLDYWPLQRIAGPIRWSSLRSVVLEKIPLLLLAVLASVITYIVQQQGGAVSTLGKLTLEVRLANALLSYGTYLLKTFWPVDLAIFYPHPGGNISVLQVVLSTLLLLAITILCLLPHHARRFPSLPVGWLWFVGTLVPVIGLVQVGAQAMADRYMYLPMIGLTAALAFLGSRLLHERASWKYAVSAIMVVVIGGMMLMTNAQLKHWKDGERLFTHALRVTENNWMAHYNLGAIYENRGELEKAKFHFMKTVEIYPGVASAFYDLGKTRLRLGETEEAIRNLHRALAMDPSLERAYLHLGEAYTRRGDLDSALLHFEKAWRFNPHYGEPRHNLALMLAGLGQYPKALQYLEAALQESPRDSVLIADMNRLKALVRERGGRNF